MAGNYFIERNTAGTSHDDTGAGCDRPLLRLVTIFSRSAALLLMLATILPTTAGAQLSYPGANKAPRGVEAPYRPEAFSGGIITVGSTLYFTTPTGRLSTISTS
jgi:hypothetical protein